MTKRSNQPKPANRNMRLPGGDAVDAKYAGSFDADLRNVERGKLVRQELPKRPDPEIIPRMYKKGPR